MNFDWAELAFKNKSEVKGLTAIFIAAPRQISSQRFKQLVKEYFPSGNLIVGIAKEDYIDGFENQPQFKTLQIKDIQKIVDTVNQSKTPYKIYTLSYFQRELPFLVNKLNFRQALFVNGSWQYAFHSRPIYYTLVNEGIPYKLLPAFTDEAEAKTYENKLARSLHLELPQQKFYSTQQLLNLAHQTAKQSYDYNFQTGLCLGQPVNSKNDQYKLIAFSYNHVVPFETYALLHGSLREKNFVPYNDLNFYDTVHAEIDLIVKAQKNKLDLKGASLFINLMPCSTCARMLSRTDIAEVVYSEDHSAGYAIKLLEAVGKKVRRVVSEEL